MLDHCSQSTICFSGRTANHILPGPAMEPMEGSTARFRRTPRRHRAQQGIPKVALEVY